MKIKDITLKISPLERKNGERGRQVIVTLVDDQDRRHVISLPLPTDKDGDMCFDIWSKGCFNDYGEAVQRALVRRANLDRKEKGLNFLPIR